MPRGRDDGWQDHRQVTSTDTRIESAFAARIVDGVRRYRTGGGEVRALDGITVAFARRRLTTVIGPSGSGKSTFARGHFLPTEVLSSDFCRGLVSDDENDQSATGDAFDLLRRASQRLNRKLVDVAEHLTETGEMPG